jgi:glycosyltransferase involved in cell wall biosynthesis
MPNPEISVVMPARNAEKTLHHAVASILCQSYDDWELLIMDDGSTDRTFAIAEQFGDRRIRAFSDGVSRGLSAQVNRAISTARGQYLARQDADDVSYPDRLQKQWDFLETHSDVDLLGGAALIFRYEGQARGVRRYPASHEQICARPWLQMAVTHATWMGRVGWFSRNPYRVDVPRAQDWELLRRTFRESHFANLPDVLVGVREDSISLWKQILTRQQVCKLALEFSRHDGDFLMAGKTIAAELPRAALDVLAVASGLGFALLPRRLQPASQTEINQWKAVWETVNSVDNHCPPRHDGSFLCVEKS